MKQTYCSLNKTSKPDTRRSWVMSCPFCGSRAFLEEAMEGEISNCLMVWTLVVVSLCYGHTAAKFVPPGKGRLLSLLPVVFLFLLLPIRLSTISLGGLTSFFVAWLCNFKLLLFAFGKGPLTSSPPLPLSRFVAAACLPIKVIKSDKAEDCKAASRESENGLGNPANYAIKCLVSACLWTILLRVVEVPPAFFNALLCVQVYVSLELSLAMTGGIARVVTGTVLEPQFNEPYLSTSLQDFWGRRWNLMVADVMHPAVYVPVRSMSGRMIGRKWAALPAAFCTFVVSALMHELIFYYIGRKKPTWAVTSFFLLHGVCVAIEIGLKKAVANKFQLPRVVSTAFTVGFVLVTGSSLFMPALLYCGMEEMGRREMLAVTDFIGNLQSKTSYALITTAASGMQSTSKL